MQRRETRTLGMVLVRDRCAEQRHDAVAGELVDEALEALDAVGEDAEEALHDPRERFRIELPGQLHRALHVGEQDGDLLALAFDGGLGLQDPLDEVFWGHGRDSHGVRRHRRPGSTVQLRHGLEQSFAVTHRDPELLEVLLRQTGHDVQIDVVGLESIAVLSEPQPLQPFTEWGAQRGGSSSRDSTRRLAACTRLT